VPAATPITSLACEGFRVVCEIVNIEASVSKQVISAENDGSVVGESVGHGSIDLCGLRWWSATGQTFQQHPTSVRKQHRY